MFGKTENQIWAAVRGRGEAWKGTASGFSLQVR
jgi:hypothetical protein